MEKLDAAIVETRNYLDGSCTQARESAVVHLIRNVHRITSSLYTTLPASKEEVAAKLRRKPRKALPPLGPVEDGGSKERVQAIELVERALGDLHYLQLKLRGSPPLDKHKLLAVAIIARDLERILFDEARGVEQLGHEGTESVEGTEDFSEDLARKQSSSAKLETASEAINRIRLLVATLHMVARRAGVRDASPLAKGLRDTRKFVELFMDQQRLLRPKPDHAPTNTTKFDALRTAMARSLDHISQMTGTAFQRLASNDASANAAAYVEFLSSVGNKLRILIATSDRRKRTATPSLAAAAVSASGGAVPSQSTVSAVVGGAGDDDGDDDDLELDEFGVDDEDDDEEVAAPAAANPKAGSALRTVHSAPHLHSDDDEERIASGGGSDEPSQSSSTLTADYVDAASRTEAKE